MPALDIGYLQRNEVQGLAGRIEKVMWICGSESRRGLSSRLSLVHAALQYFHLRGRKGCLCQGRPLVDPSTDFQALTWARLLFHSVHSANSHTICLSRRGSRSLLRSVASGKLGLLHDPISRRLDPVNFEQYGFGFGLKIGDTGSRLPGVFF